MSRKICKCGLKSVPGLVPGVALCQYHFTKKIWGAEWAAKCHPEHPEVKKANVVPAPEEEAGS